jgi:transposase
VDSFGTQFDTSVVERLLGQIGELEAALRQRDALIAEQAETLRLYAKQIEDLKQQIADLKRGGPSPKPPAPALDWVKPNANSTAKGPSGEGAPKTRKKRQHNFTWTRREPTRTVPHACDTCPDCGRGLCGGWEHSRRQIVEIPPVELEVVDHVVIARHCGVCGKNWVPEVDLSGQTVGHSHLGHRLVSLIAYLRTVGRLPQQTIVALLQTVWGLPLSVGQISEVLHRVARQGKSAYEELRDQVRGSPYAHADETGWRENGQNGYVWSFSTPFVRYFVYDRSRGHQVPEEVLGETFRGVLVSDFYSGYHYYLGLHQRCWVHLLRDVRELKQSYPTDGVLAWAKRLRDLYDRAKAFSSECPKARQAARLGFQAELLELAVPYVGVCLPQSVLAKRLVQFEAELFTFVEHPEVPSENNAAERSVRPRVIARKISGGTRSSEGSKTMAVLASLFETWRLRGENGLQACIAMLIASQQPKAETAS